VTLEGVLEAWVTTIGVAVALLITILVLACLWSTKR
jgi:hypothetical protein